MNIGFDGTRTDPNYVGGVNTYLMGLLRGLVDTGEKHRIQLYVSPKNVHIFKDFSGLSNLDLIAFPMDRREEWTRRAISYFSAYSGVKSFHRRVSDALFASWTRFIVDRSDVIYIPTTTLFPYNLKKPTVVSMHDIQHVRYPQFFTRRERLQRHIKFALTAERATYIQASSEFIKQDLLSYFKCLRPEQVCVIPEGVLVEEFSRPRDIDIADRYNVPKDFLFFPAQLWPHKNHMTVLKALNRLKRDKGRTIPLVLTGATYSAADLIFNFIKENNMTSVHYLGKVPFEDLVALYQKARFFITAVLYESSSLPFLEAAASGCATIVSDTPPNREMAKNLSTELFDPLDEIGLADLLLRVWDDDALRERQIVHNRSAVDHYHWDSIARQYLDLFDRAIQGSQHS